MRKTRVPRRMRRGATAVEFAIVAVPLFLMIFAQIEFGRGMMAQLSLEEAARAGCRVAILNGTTTAQVEAEVASVLTPAGVHTYAVQIEPTDIAAAERWSPVTVTITADFGDVSWLPIPQHMVGLSLSASDTRPKEYAGN